MEKPDVNKLKTLFEETKKINSEVKSANLKDNMSRDKFLSNLLLSLKTGQSTSSITLIKKINELAEKKAQSGDDREIILNENLLRKKQKPVLYEDNISNELKDKTFYSDIELNDDRTEELFHGFERKVADIKPKNKIPVSPKETQVKGMDYKNIDNLSFDNNDLVNNIKAIVIDFLNKNIKEIVREVVEEVMLEYYATERIRNVMEDVLDKDKIKSLVIEVIREIKSKSTQK